MNGSGSPEGGDGDGTSHPQHEAQRGALRFVEANATLWQRFRSSCTRDDGRARASGLPNVLRPGDPVPRATTTERYLAMGNNEQRLIDNHLSLRWCREAIERFERRASARERARVRFDEVIYARPDLLWKLPVTPWCELRRGAVHACPRAGCDTVWVAPREYAAPLLSQAEAHRDCEHLSNPVTPWRVRSSAPSAPRLTHGLYTDCCADAEHLLWHTIRTRQMPYEYASLPSPGKQHVLLRFVEGVCEAAFDPLYDTWQFATLKISEGLPFDTGIALRLAFGNGTMCTAFRGGKCVRPPTSSPSVAARRRAVADCRAGLGVRARGA